MPQGANDLEVPLSFVAVDAFKLGFALARTLSILVLPPLLWFWSSRLRRRDSQRWWIPRVLAVFLFVSGITSGVINAGIEARKVAEIAQVDPESIFPVDSPYRFEEVKDPALVSRVTTIFEREGAYEVVVRFATAKDGTPIGLVVAASGPPEDFVDNRAIDSAIAEVEKMGGRSVRHTIHGQLVMEFAAGPFAQVERSFVWQPPRANMMVMVLGEPADARKIATAMIQSRG